MTEKQDKAITICLVILAGVALIAALYLGRLFLVPIVIALVLNALFRPVVRRLQRLGINPWISAGGISLGLLALLIGLAMLLSWPIRQQIEKGPELFANARQHFERFREPLSKVNDVVKKAEDVTQGISSPGGKSATQPATRASADGGGGSGDGNTNSGGKEPAEAPQKSSAPAASPVGLAGGVLSTATEIVGGLAEVLLLLFLILGAGGKFFHKFVGSLSQSTQRKVAEDVVHESEALVLRYVWVTAVINICQGTLIALIMWWLKMPAPWIWGLFTFVLEFVPYLGAAVMVILLAIVALATKDQTWLIVLPPVCYLLVTNLQNNLVSPIAYGHRLKLNPAAVLIGVMFWWFVWGIPGAFIAVPIVATIKVAADRIEGLKGFGEFLGE